MVLSEMDEYAALVDLSSFLETYAPGGEFERAHEIPDIQRELKVGIQSAKNETQMYAPLCRALNEMLSLGSNYTITDTSKHVEYADHKPDLGMFDKRFGLEAWNIQSPSKYQGQWFKEKILFAWSICLLEVKFTESQDPFGENDNGELTFPNSKDSVRTRMQIVGYINQIFLRQHREFAFIVLIFGEMARLIRWDRIGAIVSRPFNYVDDVTPLLNFIYRLSKTDRAGQGFDTTVQLATEEQIAELEKFRAAAPQHSYEYKFAAEMLQDKLLYPINQLECDVLPHRPHDSWAHELEGKTLTLIIGKYRVRSYSQTGRATKGYFAYVMGQNRLVFVKISWRPDTPTATPELERYAALHNAGVPHIAVLVSGGDTSHVPTEARSRRGEPLLLRTRTQELLGISKLYDPRIQTRLVFETLGIPLSEYLQSSSLVYVVMHALEAHFVAWDKAKVLHRDISINNILIDITSPNPALPQGFLTDWDLSNDESQLKSSSMRSGTWAFMSGSLLRYPLKPPAVSDDLESFVNLLNFCALRWHWTDYTDQDSWDQPPKSQMLNRPLAEFIHSFFYQEYEQGSYWYGGDRKFASYMAPTPCFTVVPANRKAQAFKTLLLRLHALCHSHYISLDEDDLQQHAGFEQLPRTRDTTSVFIIDPQHCGQGPSSRDVPDDVLSDSGPQPEQRPGLGLGPYPAPTLSPIPEPPSTPASRPVDLLQDHTAIIAAFQEALFQGGVWEKNDKTPDQFLNLPGIAPARDKNESSVGIRKSESQRSTKSRPFTANYSSESWPGGMQ